MKDQYLEVMYRRGKPMAAYLYLPRSPGQKSTRTEAVEAGLLVDYAEDGEPIGVEITAPGRVTVQQLNAVLARLGKAGIAEEELAPLRAA